ncbi:hypothetical protein PROFUN_15995 [Planoprotostelium fungivorum]|uniref:Uncharacterized protein n=1 Tax=Planoprotostelium fungivorum TaxID=1890364 RepID=A0A2P6MTC7_9EUKA|nr:hypothetical protein PROFUN_15995 [Planoprotostelium fungivorum]
MKILQTFWALAQSEVRAANEELEQNGRSVEGRLKTCCKDIMTEQQRIQTTLMRATPNFRASEHIIPYSLSCSTALITVSMTSLDLLAYTLQWQARRNGSSNYFRLPAFHLMRYCRRLRESKMREYCWGPQSDTIMTGSCCTSTPVALREFMIPKNAIGNTWVSDDYRTLGGLYLELMYLKSSTSAPRNYKDPYQIIFFNFSSSFFLFYGPTLLLRRPLVQSV